MPILKSRGSMCRRSTCHRKPDAPAHQQGSTRRQRIARQTIGSVWSCDTIEQITASEAATVRAATRKARSSAVMLVPKQ